MIFILLLAMLVVTMQKFNATLVDRILREEVVKRVGSMEYDSNSAPQVAKELTDLIKERIRSQQFARYKIIVEVTIGQRLGQAMRTASRGLWSPSTDRCVLCNLFLIHKTKKVCSLQLSQYGCALLCKLMKIAHHGMYAIAFPNDPN